MAGPLAFPGQSRPVDPVGLAEARAIGIAGRSRQRSYTRTFDLSAIPSYQPRRSVHSVIRQWGLEYFRTTGLMEVWERGFREYHPGATFQDNLTSSAVAFPGLIAGQADLAPMGRPALWTELKGAERQQAAAGGVGLTPLEVVVCTGSFDVSGWSFAFGIFVNSANPISRLTLDQLDGIFGAERSGGWKGLAWDTSVARGSDLNIRTWGQLGLTGRWKDKEINVYGYNLSFHFPDEFDKKVLKGSQKWNERLITFANTFGAKADGTMTVAGEQMVDALADDPYGITYSCIRYLNPHIKPLPLARESSGPYVDLTLENVQNRTYPLFRDIYYYMSFQPDRERALVDPDAAEFLRYILSRHGQEAIQEHDAKYLPLTSDEAAKQLRRLESHLPWQ
ncbi:PstS family phosphate ABC transporter substrate-binding protein [Actinopolymorpha alba]|uniref:PstS family phosphate ABC transporter substrate-binding protein n=1 Tax=Actinopolymorpha alba TaxID=533267 RepID=UPI00037FDC95|nr:substrate-binding domain-containing protein [Actinopolymorpha alba]